MTGMRDYIVMVYESPSDAPRGGRSEVRQAMRKRQIRLKAFIGELSLWLKHEKLSDQVAGIAPPVRIAPMVTLTCTPMVASRIADIKGVESVFADD